MRFVRHTRRDLIVPSPPDNPTGSPAVALELPERLAGLRVRDLMTGDPVTAGPDWPLVQAVAAMAREVAGAG